MLLKAAARLFALVSLVATIAPSVWFCFSAGGVVESQRVKTQMLIAMVLWFISATLLLWPSKHAPPPVSEDAGV